MENVYQSLKSFGNPRYLSLIIIGIAMIMTLSFLSFKMSNPVMSVLYSNLNANDSSAVITELGRNAIKFEVASGGGEVRVESSEVLRVRMMLAEKGLPSQASIVGYEIFDKESMLGTSNFVMNVNYVRALEGELARTIGAMSSIKSARVHIVVPKKDVFRKEEVQPTASVVLTLNNRLDVPKQEALAVRHLVASSVPGLMPSKITIVDSNGKILAKAKSDDDESQSSGEANEYRFQMEERLKNTLVELLEQAVGAGKVEAQVNVDISLEKMTESSEKYDPEGQVARSVQTTEEVGNSSNSAGGEVSVATELTGKSGAGGGASENTSKTDEVTNYEISKTVTSKIYDTGRVKKITVAVLVDGKYTKGSDGSDIYIPRSDEELDQIRTLVRSAVGYDEARGDIIDVVNMPFSRESAHLLPEEGAMDWLKRDMDGIIKTVMLGLVVILVIVFVIRPLVNKAFDVSAADIEAEKIRAMARAEANGLTGGDMMMGNGNSGGGNANFDLDVVQSKIEYAPAQRVNDLIDNNPEETLSIIRSWLVQNR